ncbi:MAG: glycosyltransferase family 4 protein, partial [Acidobacteria bacterium]|nr:glycosyltransferase family 4 protein [Acidobacteriota bacterium]
LVAAPFIPVPPPGYGGTELFVGHLAEGLQREGQDVVVYTNGESSVKVERRSLYERSLWPIKHAEEAWIRELNHSAWSIQDAAREADIIHVQSAMGISMARFTKRPLVLTLHGPHEPYLSEYYSHYPQIHYVCISNAQRRTESMPKMHTIHHGIDLASYRLVTKKQPYLSFIGRIAPIKGTHLAIEVAQRTGIPLKIAGDVQPIYREYFEKKIRPQIDGKLVEYIGLADLNAKNELLGNSMAMLFPILWNEPFGLVMVEAMACGTPVLAMPGGSVPEVVRDGISGFLCRSVRQMSERLQKLSFDPVSVRRYVEENFSVERMVKGYMKLYQRVLDDAHDRPDTSLALTG